MHYIKELVAKQKNKIPVGIYSNCTANEFVIEAIFEKCQEDGSHALIEATANQVNQFGGYTGMLPKDFSDFVYAIALKVGFPKDKIILGGDHLGPLTWKNEHSDTAIEKSVELIKQFVLAGFTKIHIDTSMHLANDDINARLSDEVIAQRGAILCETAQKAYQELKKLNPNALQPVYIVGSEVPIPGGSQEEDEGLSVTRVEDLEKTVEVFKEAFYKRNLQEAWENVVAVVVQPGVEFGDDSVHIYNRNAAKDLCNALGKYNNIVFEGHSTDYQTKYSLKQMVEDGVAILKVGPALTFALREGLVLLSIIEKEMFAYRPDVILSDFTEVLERSMLEHPSNWEKHYHGDAVKLKLARRYSYSDRARYYLPDCEVKLAVERLISNLKTVKIPLTLISQYLPSQYTKIMQGCLQNEPEALLKDRVKDLVEDYCYAIKP